MRKVRGFRSALLAHFDRTRRNFPWRFDRTPYRVLVSEFMLQQTRASTVLAYYEPWLRRFPDWNALAGASTEEVLLAWKGLGYYARARNLHRTAAIVRDRYQGCLPRSPAVLMTLPGVGEYTAGAVGSIAFGLCAPAVDGNVRRVLARLLDAERPSASRLREEATRLLDPARPGDFNEAMMELGATVCTPRAPRCGDCPVARHCEARKEGTVAHRPAPRPPRKIPRTDYATAVPVDPQGRSLLVKRPETGLLAGMWEFPAVELLPESKRPGGSGGGSGLEDSNVETAALKRLAELGVSGKMAGRLAPVRHAFTHLRAVYHPVVVRCGEQALRQLHLPKKQAVRADPHDLDSRALPVAQQKIGARLAAWLRDCCQVATRGPYD